MEDLSDLSPEDPDAKAVVRLSSMIRRVFMDPNMPDEELIGDAMDPETWGCEQLLSFCRELQNCFLARMTWIKHIVCFPTLGKRQYPAILEAGVIA